MIYIFLYKVHILEWNFLSVEIRYLYFVSSQDDPEADAKFIRINRAYEVLKDEELRKKYDQFGEEGLENKLVCSCSTANSHIILLLLYT